MMLEVASRVVIVPGYGMAVAQAQHAVSDLSDYLGEHDVEVEVTKPRNWFFEPDASILRAGLVQDLAVTLNATLLDETIAYLTSDHRMKTQWGRYWRILDWMPFNLKKLRQYLTQRNVRHLTVKKRGFPMLPEEVIRKLKLKKGDESRVLVMTRWQGNHIVIICEAL